MVEKHAIFQGYYFFHHLGMDRNLREQFRGHPCFERTARFCERYDSPAFDPARRDPAARALRADGPPCLRRSPPDALYGADVAAR